MAPRGRYCNVIASANVIDAAASPNRDALWTVHVEQRKLSQRRRGEKLIESEDVDGYRSLRPFCRFSSSPADSVRFIIPLIRFYHRKISVRSLASSPESLPGVVVEELIDSSGEGTIGERTPRLPRRIQSRSDET